MSGRPLTLLLVGAKATAQYVSEGGQLALSHDESPPAGLRGQIPSGAGMRAEQFAFRLRFRARRQHVAPAATVLRGHHGGRTLSARLGLTGANKKPRKTRLLERAREDSNL